MVVTRKMLKDGTKRRFECLQQHTFIPINGNEKDQIKRIKNQYNPKSLQTLTYRKTLKQFEKILHQRKFDLIHQKKPKKGMINPNNKNLIVKLEYEELKEEITGYRHICIMYYGEQSHFNQDILPRLTKLFKYVWETPNNLKLQNDIPYCNIVIPNRTTNINIQKRIQQEFNYL